MSEKRNVTISASSKKIIKIAPDFVENVKEFVLQKNIRAYSDWIFETERKEGLN